MKTHCLLVAALIAAGCAAFVPARAQEVTTEVLDGATNLHRIGTTVACSGAIKPEVVPEIKKMGFVSIINLRQDSEAGSNVEAEAAAAKAVGLRYYHIPFSASAPDAAAADKFLASITQKGAEPAFIHCAGGGRAATMWFIKRMVADHWDEERAEKEAMTLGAMSPSLKQFAINYAENHKR